MGTRAKQKSVETEDLKIINQLSLKDISTEHGNRRLEQHYEPIKPKGHLHRTRPPATAEYTFAQCTWTFSKTDHIVSRKTRFNELKIIEIIQRM